MPLTTFDWSKADVRVLPGEVGSKRRELKGVRAVLTAKSLDLYDGDSLIERVVDITKVERLDRADVAWVHKGKARYIVTRRPSSAGARAGGCCQ